MKEGRGERMPLEACFAIMLFVIVDEVDAASKKLE